MNADEVGPGEMGNNQVRSTELDPVDLLGQARYLLLVTYRKNGVAVPTPVWVVPSGRKLLVWTNPAAGKVKRIRRSARVRVAPCSYRGTPYGPLLEATARIMPDEVNRDVRVGLIAKYGLQARLALLPGAILRLLRRPMPSSTISISL